VKVREIIRLIEEHSATGGPEVSPNYSEHAKRYLVLIEGGAPSNYSAWSPDLPGCVATGDELEQCVANMRDAIAFHLEGLATEGEPIPEPSGPGIYVESAVR
jgi:predicted RNase H-like HicB family nuclease